MDNLREINRGKWTGNSPADIASKFGGDVSSLKELDFDAHDGETLRKVTWEGVKIESNVNQ